MVTLICAICGQPYQRHRSKAATSKFCSRKCQAEWKRRYASGPNSRLWNSVSKTCPWCGKEFWVRRSHAHKYVYCSLECSRQAKAAKGHVEVTCLCCGKAFEVIRSRLPSVRFCSNECRRRYHSVLCKCKYCGKEWYEQRNRVVSGAVAGHFCSMKCFALYHKGKPRSEEHRRHLSEALKGKPKPLRYRLRRIVKGTPVLLRELAHMYESGMSMKEIAAALGISREAVSLRLRLLCVQTRGPSFGKKLRRLIQCDDGHVVHSQLEQAIDNWLFANGIPHEVQVPVTPTRKWTADFRVGTLWIEVDGLKAKRPRRRLFAAKLAFYRKHGYDFLVVSSLDDLITAIAARRGLQIPLPLAA